MTIWHYPTNLKYLLKEDKLSALFANAIIRRVSVSLLTLFSPIYAYTVLVSLGFTQSHAIVLAIGYYLIISITRFTTYLFSENLSQIIGFKKTIWASTIPFSMFIVLLIYARDIPLLLIPTAIVAGIQSGLFWWGYHGIFVKVGKEKFGSKMGIETFLETLVGVVTPITGAVVVDQFGFAALFVFASILFVLSLVFLIPIPDVRQKRDVKLLEVVKTALQHKKISLAYIGNGGEMAVEFFYWPLFLFITFKGVLELGGIISLATFISGVFMLLIGRRIDKRGEKQAVAIGSPILALSWFSKAVLKFAPFLAIADSFWLFSEGMMSMSLISLTYEKAIEGGVGKAVLFREFTLHVGFVLSLILLSIWILSGGGLAAGFLIAMTFSLLPLIPVSTGSIHEHKR